ncbi:MAG: aminotransferase class V-fold PLP-dependent enzyme [Planctomycetes bacterium]|nr:aminotransferase class V-fold PLP-dependent enzyme [Planctomycetota bacterium]
MIAPIRTDATYACELDEQDELAGFRERFVIDEPGLIYLDGNSLGRLPKECLSRAQTLVREQWGGRLVRGWNEQWIDLPQRLGAKLARLVGAAADEVIVADSTSVNFFKLALAALQARPGRTKVVTDDLNFPSDLYVLQSAVKLAGWAESARPTAEIGAGCGPVGLADSAHTTQRKHAAAGHRLEIVPSRDGITIPIDALAEAIDADTALVALSHTAFKSGFVYDTPSVTELAHSRGALVLWDLCHSVGAMPLSLADAGADLAVGCTYKYSNGGPGSPAFLYVRRDLQAMLQNPIAGWFGHRDQFAFALDYEPAGGLRQLLTGTPPIVSLALIEPGLDLLLEAGLDRVRAKSVRQTEYLIGLWQALLQPLGFTLNSPRHSSIRGSHVSLGHPEGLRIDRALIDRMNVIPDFRYPDNIRLGVCPLYTTYTEIHSAVTAMRYVVAERLYEQYPAERQGVT